MLTPILKPGEFYLFSPPLFWTFVGRYVGEVNFQTRAIEHAMYFTRPGATFDVLASEGLILTGDRKSLYHPTRTDCVLADGTVLPNGNVIPPGGPVWHWTAATPWAKGVR